MKSSNAKRRRQRELQKKKQQSNQQQKNNFARAAHFFVHFFAVVLHDHSVKLTSYTFYGKQMSYVLTKDFVACVPVRFFFSLPLILTLLASPCQPLAFLIFSRLADTKFSRCLSSKIRLLCFLSLALALSLLSTSVQTRKLSRKKTELNCCFFSLKVRVATRFRAKNLPFGLPYLLIELFYIGIPAVRTDVGRMDVRSRDYQNFSDAYITIINQITVKPIKTKAQKGMIHDAHKKTA